MGLLLSVLIGCVGVLELLTCLKHATNGVPFYIEHSTPCLFYHHSDSVNCSSYDCICNISSFSQTSFPTSVKYKLENLHEYSLRVRNDIRSLGERYAGTLSDCSTKDLLRVSRSDSRHSDDFEAEMSGNLGVEETSDAQSESGFRIWDSIFLPSEFNSNLRMSSLKSFRSIDSNIRSCSLNEDVKELSFNGFEHQDLTNLSLDMHYVKESENSIESMDYDEKDIFENFNKINLFSKTDGVLQNENEQMISKSFARHHSITGEAKKDRHKEGATFGESIKTTNDLLRSKYFNTTKNLSPEKKRFVSVQVQTNLEEICPNGDTSYCLKDSFSDAQNERTINLISKLKSKKEHHSMLLSPSETNSVNRGPTETSAFLDSENCDKKTTNKSIKKTTNDDVNLSLKDKVFNSGQSFEEYVDAEDEQITILEYQVNAPIKYAVPDAGEKNAFWERLTRQVFSPGLTRIK